MADNFTRSTPEEALKMAQKEGRGTLKIFLGYAPGVGKTFSMLNEGNRRLSRGQDVVIGYIETHGREETIEQIGSLPIIPRKKIEYNGVILEEMDTDAVIRRKPKLVIIDELAHNNVPGSNNKKRYEDIEEILAHGINVITTLNIQHMESLNDVIRQITGVTVNETIPDRIVETADEVVIVDLTPDALQGRLRRGSIYKKENIESALKNFFRKGNLNALREIALRLAAEEVDEDLEDYKKSHDIKDNWYTVERVMVCITPGPSAKKLIRRGARIAKRYKCEFLVVTVDCTNIFSPKLTKKDRENLESHFKLAKELEAEVVTLTGKSISQTLTSFAEKRHITQIIIGHSNRTNLQTLLRGSTVNRLLKHNKGIEIHIIPD
jgi:two-component system sensor histidine kinase KdpD